jgi:hypothetical protein
MISVSNTTANAFAEPQSQVHRLPSRTVTSHAQATVLKLAEVSISYPFIRIPPSLQSTQPSCPTTSPPVVIPRVAMVEL